MAASAPGGISLARVGERALADRDDGMELRVQPRDPVEVELDELDRCQPMAVHERLELRDRRCVDIDAGNAGRGWLRRGGDRRRGANHPEQESCQRGKD